VLRPPPTQGPFGRDFEAYYAAGTVWDAGGDPWSRDVWRVERTIGGVEAQRDELLPYAGPAAALPLFGALAKLPFDAAVALWTALLALALGALVVVALVLAGVRDRRAFVAAFVFAFAAGPTSSGLGLGQAALLAAGGIALALLACERRSTLGATLAMLAAAVQPNLAVVLVARLRDAVAWRASVAALAVFAGLTFVAGPDVLAYLHHLAAHGAAERLVAIQFTPAAIAWSAGASARIAQALGTTVALLAIVAVVVVTVRARLRPLDGTLLAFAALPFVIPFFHEHDFGIELLPLLLLALRARGVTRTLAAVAAVLVLTDTLGMAQRPLATASIVAQGLAVAAAFVALGRGALRGADAAPFVALAALALVALSLARGWPAPVWPDALGPAYHAPARADASAVWADEQRAVGLAAQVPAWGALRALPLLGCAALGVALVLARDGSPDAATDSLPVADALRRRRRPRPPSAAASR
jgi:hypothetical protein